MTDKELHRLGRRELLQLLLEQGRESEKTKRILEETEAELHQLQETYERLRKRLDHKDEQIHELNALLEAERTKREIELSESGSIAEAALRLNTIFEVAQKAADQYLYNIKRLHDGEEELPKIVELMAAETANIPEQSKSSEQNEAADLTWITEPIEVIAEESKAAEDKAEKAEQTAAQEQIECTEEKEASEKSKETELEEMDFEEENPKVILLEHVKAEKIRRAEQEAEFAIQTASVKKMEAIDTEEELQAVSAAGTKRVKEAIGIKISESGMRAIVTELQPKKTSVTAPIENQSMLESNPKQSTVEPKVEQSTSESKAEQSTMKVADRPELKMKRDKKEAKRGTFFRQMGKFMRFKVK